MMQFIFIITGFLLSAAVVFRPSSVLTILLYKTICYIIQPSTRVSRSCGVLIPQRGITIIFYPLALIIT